MAATGCSEVLNIAKGQKINVEIEDVSNNVICVKFINDSKYFRGVLLADLDCSNLLGVNLSKVESSSVWPPSEESSNDLKSIPCSTDRYSYKENGQTSSLHVFKPNAHKRFHRKQRPDHISRILRPRRFVCRKCKTAFHSSEPSSTIDANCSQSSNGNKRINIKSSNSRANLKPIETVIKQVTPPIIPVHQIETSPSTPEEDYEFCSADSPCSPSNEVSQTSPSSIGDGNKVEDIEPVVKCVKKKIDKPVDGINENVSKRPTRGKSSSKIGRKRKKVTRDDSHTLLRDLDDFIPDIVPNKISRSTAKNAIDVVSDRKDSSHLTSSLSGNSKDKNEGQSVDSYTISSSTTCGSDICMKLGLSIRRVKDCEKPKNRWIRAERMRRSQENNSHSSSLPACNTSGSLSSQNFSSSPKWRSKSCEDTPASSHNTRRHSSCKREFIDQESHNSDLSPSAQQSNQSLSLRIRIGRNSGNENSNSEDGKSEEPVANNYSVRVVEENTESNESAEQGAFSIGDIVWSKLAGWPFWPAEITKLQKASSGNDKNKTIACLRWFAWNQVSYMDCEKLDHFQEHYKKRYNKKRKGASYHQAVDLAMKAAERREVQKSSHDSSKQNEEVVLPSSICEVNEVPIAPVIKKTVRPKKPRNSDSSGRKTKQKVASPAVIEDKQDSLCRPCPVQGDLPSFDNPLEFDKPCDNEVACNSSLIDVVTTNDYSIPEKDLQPISPSSACPIAVDIPTFSEAESDDDCDLTGGELSTTSRLIIDQEPVHHDTSVAQNHLPSHHVTIPVSTVASANQNFSVNAFHSMSRTEFSNCSVNMAKSHQNHGSAGLHPTAPCDPMGLTQAGLMHPQTLHNQMFNMNQSQAMRKSLFFQNTPNEGLPNAEQVAFTAFGAYSRSSSTGHQSSGN